jgi:hypothetical protein
MAKKQPPNPVTPAAADAFAMAIHRFQGELNMLDWRIERSPKPAGKKNMAEVASMDLEARLAVYRIGEDFGSRPVTQQSVEEIACHEVLHIFLHPLIEAARNPATSPELLNSIEHAAIHALVRRLVPEE